MSSPNSEAFLTYLANALPHVEAAISSWKHTSEAEGRAQADLDTYLYSVLDDFTASGGKRVRPALCLLGAQAVGGDPDDALSAAVAVELFQSAALIHDDIADNGQMRRGEPCVHVSQGTGIAINAGDLALVDVFGSILADPALSSETRTRVIAELYEMTVETLEGQALDLGWARDGVWDLSSDDYMAMATRKTAHYSCTSPLVVGAIVGGGCDAQIEALKAFGHDAGLTFQIADDLLNLVGDTEVQGKDFRSDITEGKRTLVALEALARLEESESAELAELLTSHTDDPADLARAVALMEGCGAIQVAREKAETLVADACQALEGAGFALDAASVEVLQSMARWFVEREA